MLGVPLIPLSKSNVTVLHLTRKGPAITKLILYIDENIFNGLNDCIDIGGPYYTFLLGFLEILAVLNLVIHKDQKAAELLFKTILITSGGGAVIFGILFSPTLIAVYG